MDRSSMTREVFIGSTDLHHLCTKVQIPRTDAREWLREKQLFKG